MSKSNHKRTNLMPFFLIAVVITTFSGVYSNFHAAQAANKSDWSQIKIDGFLFPQPKMLTPFQLTDSNHKIFNQQNLLGHWTMMFFGFTDCQYVCPTTLSELNKFYKNLKTDPAHPSLPQVVFVTVDPDRDTLSRMHDYVISFNSHFLGARTDNVQLQNLAKQLNVTYKKVPTSGTDYMMQHSSEIMLIDPKGELFAYFSYPHEAAELAHGYEAILRNYH